MDVRDMTRPDLKEVLDIHIEAFKDHAISKLGKSYNKNFIEFFMVDPHSICLVACKQDKILGYVFGAPDGYQKRFNKKIIMSKYLAVLFKPYILFDIKVLKAIGRALMERIKFINQIENLDKKSDAFSLVGIGAKTGIFRQASWLIIMQNF